MTNYEENARDFLQRIGATVEIIFKGKSEPKYWKDGNLHNTYEVTIRRDGKKYTYTFYDSIVNTQSGKQPTEYDVLSCLEKYEVGDYEEFCAEFGYDAYNDYGKRKYNNLWLAVKDEYTNVNYIFGDVLDEFAEICS